MAILFVSQSSRKSRRHANAPTKQQQKSNKKGKFGSFTKETSKKNDHQATMPHETAGGTFHCALTRSDPSSRLVLMPESTGSKYHHSSTSSLNSSTTSLSSVLSSFSDEKQEQQQWKSCGVSRFHRHSPLIVKTHCHSSEPVHMSTTMKRDESTELGMAMARSRRLPGTWCYSNNVILVNKERFRHGVSSLVRRNELDLLARQQARKMAENQSVEHSDPSVLRDAIVMAGEAIASNNNKRNDHKKNAAMIAPCRRLGENVASGSSIRDIHAGMMKTLADKNNLVDRRYTHMGMGTARGSDGRLYMCQIFRG